jgi:hypothetical protein
MRAQRPPNGRGPSRAPSALARVAAAPAWPLALADLRGLARIGFDATLGVTDLVEQMHRTIVDLAPPLGRPRAGRTRGLTGLVYGGVRGITRLSSRVADTALAAIGVLAPATTAAPPAPSSVRREAARAVLNGIWGDHLAATGNPLAIEMALRVHGHPLLPDAASLRHALPAPTGRVALLIHGLCMNDLQWARQGHHHGEMLAREAGWTVLTLHYNSGLHVSDNGRRLSALLDELVAHWPVPLSELALVGHSMGGLVARAACHSGADAPWRRRLTRLVCLGTPHHGTRLERGGHWLGRALEWSPYAAPFARPGKARSAGITDLRWGNVQEADHRGRHRHHQDRDDRVPTPLPTGVRVGFLAATTAEQPRGVRHALLGDGLVTLASAWGEHRDPALALRLPASRKALITAASHWDLLSHPQAAATLLRWMA